MQSNGEYLSPVPIPPLLNISVNCHKYFSLLQLTLNSHNTEDDSCTSQTISVPSIWLYATTLHCMIEERARKWTGDEAMSTENTELSQLSKRSAASDGFCYQSAHPNCWFGYGTHTFMQRPDLIFFYLVIEL